MGEGSTCGKRVLCPRPAQTLCTNALCTPSPCAPYPCVSLVPVPQCTVHPVPVHPCPSAPPCPCASLSLHFHLPAPLTDGQPICQVVDPVPQHHHPDNISGPGSGGQRGAVGVSMGVSVGLELQLWLQCRQVSQLSPCSRRDAGWVPGPGPRALRRSRGSYLLVTMPRPPWPRQGSLQGSVPGEDRGIGCDAGPGGSPAPSTAPVALTVVSRLRRSIPRSSSTRKSR